MSLDDCLLFSNAFKPNAGDCPTLPPKEGVICDAAQST